MGDTPNSFLDDPSRFFDHSYTKMHSLDRGTLEKLQLEALKQRFADHRATVAMLNKLAERQAIAELPTIEAVVPLLFENTMYKSYPVLLLEQGNFPALTRWLGKLTSVDLASVDASRCTSIDEWLDLLAHDAGLDCAIYADAANGLLTMIPWSSRDLRKRDESRRVTEFQSYGDDIGEDADASPIHYIGTVNRHRRDHTGPALSGGREDHGHYRRPPDSADLLFLAARMRLAAARGDASNVKVPEALLARRVELVKSQHAEIERDANWMKTIEALQGERILWSIFPHDLHAIAIDQGRNGGRWRFAEGSAVTLSGGVKPDLPTNWRDTVRAFLDLRFNTTYSMVELAGSMVACDHGRYHVPPWIIPFVLDPDDSSPYPRAGVQTGRGAFFDLLPESHWGGVITGDEIEINFDEPCGCGAASAHIGPNITRLSDKKGGDDKISCAGTPEAHAEAMQFLTSY